MIHFYRLSFLLVAFLFSVLVLPGQDARFAQFYAAPQQLNPALTGVYPGSFRFVANYRDQYSSILGSQPFRTISATFEGRKRVMQGDYIGFGLTALRDQAGESRFSRTQAHLAASFLKQTGGGRYSSSSQYLVAGAQLGAGQNSFTWEQLWFSKQFVVDASGRQAFINQNMSSEEDFLDQRTNLYLDFNAGILWYSVFDDNASFYVGGAFYHLNQPNISFMENTDDRLYRRWTAHAGGELPLTDQLSLLPAAAVMGQGASLSSSAGVNFRYNRHEWKEVAIRAGLWGHVSNMGQQKVGFDAAIVSAILEMERWQFGLSYDITMSKLSAANNGRGAFEVSLIYVHPEQGRRRGIECPKF